MNNKDESTDKHLHRSLGRILVWIAIGVVLVVLVVLLANREREREQRRSFGVSIVGYNHTTDGIDFFVNGSMGGNISPHGGGGRHACCVALPVHYKPGMTVQIMWEATAAGPGNHIYQTREVQVPPYDAKKVAVLAVHFLKSGEIKVLGTNLTLEHPDYPIKEPR